MPRVALYTLGCKVSQYETEAIAERFEDLGFDIVSSRSSADVYVINTCTVTAESDRKCRQVIRRLKGRVTVILTTHYMEEAQSLSDRIGIMKDGRLLAVGTAEELIQRALDGVEMVRV